jgi:DNA polymerase bacteriophage-type
MPICHLDFETRSRVDLKKCGAGRYADDPSTQILCVCWAVDNGPVFGHVGPDMPKQIKKMSLEGYTFSAFNAIFEQLIWKYLWPEVPVPEFICTRALSAAHGLPQGLDRACKALHIGSSKDREGTRLIGKYSIPRKDGIFNELAGEDEKKMLQYCAKDVVLSRRILQRLPLLSEIEQEVYNWTVLANLRGLTIDVNLAQKAEGIANALQNDGNKELSMLTNKRIFSVSQIARIRAYLKEVFGVQTESLDKEAIEELLLRDSLPDAARRVLELRRDLSQSSVRKFKKARMSVCSDGKIRDTLIYHGAATGRFTSQVVQFQNLPKYTVTDPKTALDLVDLGDPEVFNMSYKSPMLALSGCIRGLVMPGKGQKLAIVDYNAIEARVLMWVAGQQDVVDGFHQGRDLYVEMAQRIYRNKTLTKKNKKERTLGKVAILGLGYGMSHLKFQATCDAYGIELGEKTEYDEREDRETKKPIRTYYAPLAKRAVDTYRQTYTQVPRYWYSVQRAAEQCVRNAKPATVGGVTFSRPRDFLYLALPSGRRLAYHRPGIDKDGLFYYTEDSASYTYGKKRTYGSRLVENIIQAIARDILTHGILNLEKAGFPVILTVHDENVVEVKHEKQLDEVIKIMCELPAWAKGCPISAEGFIADRYRKG